MIGLLFEMVCQHLGELVRLHGYTSTCSWIGSILNDVLKACRELADAHPGDPEDSLDSDALQTP